MDKQNLIKIDDVLDTLVEEGQRSRRYKFGEQWELNLKEIQNALNNIPASDMVKIVECIDCIHAIGKDKNLKRWWCEVHRGYMEDNYFCADGKLFE